MTLKDRLRRKRPSPKTAKVIVLDNRLGDFKAYDPHSKLMDLYQGPAAKALEALNKTRPVYEGPAAEAIGSLNRIKASLNGRNVEPLFLTGANLRMGPRSSTALEALERMNVQVDQGAAARALEALSKAGVEGSLEALNNAGIDSQSPLGVRALEAILAVERTFRRFRNVVAHIPSFDAEVRDFASALAEAAAGEVDLPTLAVGTVVESEKPVEDGVLIRCTSLIWTSVVRRLKADWSQAYQIPPRVWEEIIAGGFKEAKFDDVILTPRSGDHGRDLIAVKRGFGSIRILGSVKAYGPKHLITKEEVHALMGVVSLDPNASKGLFVTTSDFAPLLLEDQRLAAAVPHRIELMNGQGLQQWLKMLLDEE